MTRSASDMESLDLKEILGSGDHAVLSPRWVLQGLVDSDKYGRKVSGMDKRGVVYLGPRNLCEVARSGFHVER